MDTDAEYPHRGRIQAQGGRGTGIEESEPWAQQQPLTASDGQALLSSLYNKLGPADRKSRQSGFDEARAFIEAASKCSGTGPIRKTFPKKPNAHKERIDIEVLKGLAFVPTLNST